MYNMTVYSDRERKLATLSMTATDATVTGLTARTENVTQKLCMDSSSSALCDDVGTKRMNCCGAVRPNRRMMPKSIGQ
jgi:hypothetical protein